MHRMGSGTAWAIVGLAMGFTGASGGCATRADVLEGGQEFTEGDRRTPKNFSTCDLEGGGITGDSCGFGPEPGSNESQTAYCSEVGACSLRDFGCSANGALLASTLEVEGCSDGEYAGTPSHLFTDCPTALQDGTSGDGCSADFMCAQRNADPCCVDVAACITSATFDWPPAPSPGLRRFQVCSLGCENLNPVPELPTATDCASAQMAGQPCTGSFVCWGVDLSTSIGTPAALHGPMVKWCGHGVVQKGARALDNAPHALAAVMP